MHLAVLSKYTFICSKSTLDMLIGVHTMTYTRASATAVYLQVQHPACFCVWGGGASSLACPHHH